MEALGFYVCDADLEDELIRASGRTRVERVVAANGDLKPFRTLQKQPEWRDRPTTSSYAASWAAAAGERRAMRASSSRRSSSRRCPGRSIGLAHVADDSLE